MEEMGYYVFCAVQTEGEEREYGQAELAGAGRQLLTVHYKDSALIVAEVPLKIYHPNKDNLMAHQAVVSKVMTQSDTVIPMSFGNVFKSKEDVAVLLESLYPQFAVLFPEIKGKIELGLKVIGKKEWLENEIRKRPQFAKAKRAVHGKSKDAAYYDRIRLGEMAQKLMSELRSDVKGTLFESLKKISAAAKANEPTSETMLLNAAFLIDRDQEKHFDREVNAANDKWKDRVEFKYTGPWAAYNFIHINLQIQAEGQR
ncbi:GvpL/GvpF family gas vesicle protein [Paenibacillus sp. 1P07SE]|uniref:GvpL/GvpF family gas vesicle protein n=1 Tax=Paenibacillus sp. 1P07SE TaxID=3132209 RepID=UPI0039A7136D